jgi:hypothetical protein
MIAKYNMKPVKNTRIQNVENNLRIPRIHQITGIKTTKMPTGRATDSRKAAPKEIHNLVPIEYLRKQAKRKKNSDSVKPNQKVIELGNKRFTKTTHHAM